MNTFKNLFKSFFYIIFYFILSIIVYNLFNISSNDNSLMLNVINICSDLIILFIFIIIFRNNIVPDFYDFKKRYKEYLSNNFKYYLIGLMLMVISNIIIGCFIGLPTNEEINRQLIFNLPISSVISLVIVVPVIEELLTRKNIKDTFNNKYLFFITSGLIFGLLHLLSATSLIECLYIIPYGVLGISFAKIYYNSNNIWTNIFFHSLHNLIAIIILFVGV